LFGWLKKKDRKQTAAFELYTAMVTQARQPDFYAKLGVPDKMEGRFDLILVHAFILFRRLKADDGDRDLAQRIFDVMFADLDQNMREMGIGDVGILKGSARCLNPTMGALLPMKKVFSLAQPSLPPHWTVIFTLTVMSAMNNLWRWSAISTTR